MNQFALLGVEVDLDVVRSNARFVADHVAPARLCGVVKVDGYGHGSLPVARAALQGGASSLAVALVEEGTKLRGAGIAAPILLLSEPPAEAMEEVVGNDLTPTLYTETGVAAVGEAGRLQGRTVGVQLKLDTGMHRVGADLKSALAVRDAVTRHKHLQLDGIWSHFAAADEPTSSYTELQVERFDQMISSLGFTGEVHLANTPATLRDHSWHRSMVRCGGALYGLTPTPAFSLPDDLRPTMAVKASVTLSRRLAAGEPVSYGLRFRTERPTTIATVPVGYADGVPRRLGATGGEVLIRGKRRRIAGSVTMDQLMVDCGDDNIRPGEEVVLIGSQDGESITASEWATKTESISYEVICRIGPRLPRKYLGDNMPT